MHAGYNDSAEGCTEGAVHSSSAFQLSQHSGLCTQAMGIQRYLFFSIHNCQKHPNVPLMRIKSASEDFLQQSGVPYTIFRLCGFMQVQAP